MSEPVPDPAPPADWRERLELLARGSTVSPAQVAVGALALLAAALLAWVVLRQPSGPPAEASMTPVGGAATTSTTAPPVVLAHAAGAVRAPGLYRLEPDARVADLLAAAGGPVPEADLDRVNLAAPVGDGSQVYVPRVGEAVPATAAGAGGGAAGEASGPLDLNTATQAQLEDLPGVGPSTAQAILAEREKRGRFGSVEELLEVRGIGPAKLEALRDLVTV